MYKDDNPEYKASDRAFYSSRSLKRHRMSKQELSLLLETSKKIIKEESIVTIRHLFYRLATEFHLIPKTQLGYNNLDKHLIKWRRSGTIDYSSFADNTRWYYGNSGYRQLSNAVRSLADGYCRDPWMEKRVEIWTEKDAMASILLKAANKYRVRVFSARGFNSLTALYSIAQDFKFAQAEGREVFVYYFGDYDPKGLEIDNAMTNTLKNDMGITISFERVAITPEQIIDLNLPTRPTKKHSGAFEGDSVEVDVMKTKDIIALVDAAIEPHIDRDRWSAIQEAERLEREGLNELADKIEHNENSRQLGAGEAVV